jgi:hypothetical protein
MNIGVFGLAVLFAATLSGSSAAQEIPSCNSPGPHVWGAPLSSQDIAIPAVGQTSEAELGQSMISAVRAEIMSTDVIVREDFDGDGRFLGIGTRIHIPAGKLDFVGSNSAGGAVFLASGGWLKYSSEPRPRKSMEVGVVLPADHGPPLTFFRGGALTRTFPADALKLDVGRCQRLGSTGFRRELVYGGVTQGTVSILYREFSGDLARPAFSQELKYDLSKGREVGYKGARFEILDANNTVIRFRVLRPLS